VSAASEASAPPASERIEWLQSLPFIGVHLAGIAGVIYYGFSWWGLSLAVALYFIRMFGLTAGFHRYFSHRSYKTSRVFQFVLAVLGSLCAQKDPLWWAAHHRMHHKYSDTERDPHSARTRGVYWSHMGWFLVGGSTATRWDKVQDLAKYPELRLLNRLPLAMVLLLGVVLWLAGGWEAVSWGLLSTAVLWHGTFTVNSLAHKMGSRRFETPDDSRNNLFIALITLGEGWHNNHHHYQRSERQGFYWWEIDITHYVLKLLERAGIVWALHEPPANILAMARVDEETNERVAVG